MQSHRDALSWIQQTWFYDRFEILQSHMCFHEIVQQNKWQSTKNIYLLCAFRHELSRRSAKWKTKYSSLNFAVEYLATAIYMSWAPSVKQKTQFSIPGFPHHVRVMNSLWILMLHIRNNRDYINGMWDINKSLYCYLEHVNQKNMVINFFKYIWIW